MTISSSRSEWRVPAGLIALSVVPVAAGMFRIGQLAGGAVITPDNARFFASPLPVVLHIVSATVYCIGGALQFAPGFRRRNPRWHRRAGRLFVLCGLMVAVTGLWMTLFYPPVDGDGPFLYGMRLMVGSTMVLCLGIGFAAIRQRDVPRHRAWMMRGYALALGAGTQAFTHLPWLVYSTVHDELARAISMAAGWVINLAVVEWTLRGGASSKASLPRFARSPRSLERRTS